MPSSTSCSETKSQQHTDTVRPQPPLIFGVVVFAAVALLLLSRGVLPTQDSPAFSVETASGVRILLGEGFPNPGVHQFSDGTTVNGVIELTGVAGTHSGAVPNAGASGELIDGMSLAIGAGAGPHGEIERGWMPARQRMALGIPLHPDRMRREDWVTLPGIGEKLAAEIEQDRQNYGDFGRFEALERVKGIGPAKLKALRPLFVAEAN